MTDLGTARGDRRLTAGCGVTAVSGEALAMSSTCPGLQVVVVLLLSVVAAADAQSVDVQHLNVVGQRRIASGSARREVYRTTYTRETAAHGRHELVPEVININIEKQEHTR